MTLPFATSTMAVLSMYPTRSSRRHLQRFRHWENRRRRVLSHLNYQDWFERDGARAIGIATTTRTLCSCWMCTYERRTPHPQLRRAKLREYEGYWEYLDEEQWKYDEDSLGEYLYEYEEGILK